MFLSISQIMERLAVGRQVVRGLIRSGKLTAYRIGGQVRVREDEVTRFVESAIISPKHKSA